MKVKLQLTNYKKNYGIGFIKFGNSTKYKTYIKSFS